MVRYKANHKEQTRERIIAAAGRCFRKGGYSGIGVDGLAKEAGVTSGAFYGHFASKEDAFIEAVSEGLMEVHDAVLQLQASHGQNWVKVFIDFYLSTRLTCDLAEACALQALTSEVTRASDAVRTVYQHEIEKVIQVIAQGLPDGVTDENISRSWALLAILSGGVTMARALANDELSAHVAKGLRTASLAVLGISEPSQK